MAGESMKKTAAKKTTAKKKTAKKSARVAKKATAKRVAGKAAKPREAVARASDQFRVSKLIDARIKQLRNWRGKTLARVLCKAEPEGAVCMGELSTPSSAFAMDLGVRQARHVLGLERSGLIDLRSPRHVQDE